jgi:hypothetical protein
MTMKTPEELAEEWSRAPRSNQDVEEYQLSWDLVCDWEKESFLAGYQAAVPQWISVKDRLPEEFNDYVAFGYGPTIPARHFLAEYEPKTKRWYERDHDWDLTDTILYWMPLPKPPEE